MKTSFRVGSKPAVLSFKPHYNSSKQYTAPVRQGENISGHVFPADVNGQCVEMRSVFIFALFLLIVDVPGMFIKSRRIKSRRWGMRVGWKHSALISTAFFSRISL